MSGFILPFVIVYGTSLLGLGPWHEILWSSISALIGVWMFSIVLVGFYQKRVNVLWRVALAVGGLGLMTPGLISDAVGFAILIPFLVTNTSLFRKKAIEPAV